jgi:TonB family protein
MREAVLALNGSAAALILVKATVVLVLGLVGERLLTRSRAAVRHALLAATFGVLFLLPALCLIAPPVRIGVRAAPVRSAQSIAPRRSPVHFTSASTATAKPPLETLLLWAWAAGTALFLVPVAIGLWQVHRLRQSGLPWRKGQPLADALAREAGVERRVNLLLHKTLSGPMTCGILHHAIVLPQDAETWDEHDLTRALIHELEHVRRNDWLIHSLSRIVGALYWFHPLAWTARRRLELEAERSCDDAVLGCSDPADYANQLVGLARRVSKAPLLAMANRADLSVRVNAVLDSRQPRGRAGKLAVMAACTAAALLLSIAPLKMVAAPQAMLNLADDVGLVVINVTVADRNGNSVEGLTANDFTLTENGAPQTIVVFEYQKPDNLPSYYLLGYYTAHPQEDGSFRSIKVAGKRDDMVTLRYRTGYYAKAVQFHPPTAVVDTRRSSVDGHFDPGIKQPTVIYKVDPEYSEEARRAKYSGTVILSVDITPDGKASNIRVMTGLGLGLDEKAIEAVSKWRFKPGTKDGQPITVTAMVGVSFRLL